MSASGETVAALRPPRLQKQLAMDGEASAIPAPAIPAPAASAADAAGREAAAGSQDVPETIDKAAFLRRFVESALQQAREGSLDEYHRLVRVFAYTRHGGGVQAAARYAADVAPWIPALAASVSALGLGFRELVGTVLGSDWVTVPDDGVAHRYATLVLQLVSARPEWVPQATAALVRWFGFGARRADEAEAPRVHARAHRLLREICRAVPTSGSSLLAALGELWPFRTAKTRLHVLFVRNALCCLDYAPGARREVLRMVLNHMIQLDVEVQVELEDLESGSDDDGDNDNGEGLSAAADEGVFPFDAGEAGSASDDSESDRSSDTGSDSDSGSGSDSDSSSGSDGGSDSGSVRSARRDAARARASARRTAATLDAVMSTVLGWLEPQFAGDVPAADPAAASELFLVFLDLFGAVVLPTFRSRYTQFVLFYLCGRDAQYADVFLGTVVGKVGDPARGAAQDAVSGVTRVAAAAYLGSLVARARFLRAPIVRSVVGVLVQWASAYLDWQDEQQRASGSSSAGSSVSGTGTSGAAAGRAARSRAVSAVGGAGLVPSASQQQRQLQQPVDLERHAVFYAVTQAVLYMFCFRWRDLAEAPGGGPVVESELDNLRWCAELEGLQRVVFSRLNPLRAAAPAVAQQFASVASQTNFMFCYAVLQQNRRANPDGDAAAAAATGGAGSGGMAPGTRCVPRGGGADQMLRARLDSFFPFDPMALPVSRQFIDASYLEWHDVGEALSDAEADADADVAAPAAAGRRGPGLHIPVDEASVIDQISAMSVSPAAPLSALPGRDFASQLRR